jgi:cell wall-associated NlpC family hydrolase
VKRYLAVIVVAALLAPAGFADEPQDPPTSMIERALSWIGVRYRFGGQDEKKGFDCAGLVRRVYATIAVDLPRTAAGQYREGCLVPREELQPGDLVFFRNTYKRGISHVGIYIGGGRFVHAASRRRSVVVDDLDAPYYRKRYAGARRIESATAAGVAPASGRPTGLEDRPEAGATPF